MGTGLVDEVRKTSIPDIDAISELLESEEDEGELFEAANDVKVAQYGNTVFVRAIVEFSSYCRQHCAYCGLGASVPKAQRYRMEPDEIVETALEAASLCRTVVLQSGEDPHYTPQMLADIVGRIRARSDVAITMSVGERSPMAYRAMREAGADRFLIKHETADTLLYEKLHGAKLSDRIECQNQLRELGFEVGSGFMVGLPGQTDATLAADILLLQSQEVDMAGIGPFIPHPDTMLADYPPGSTRKTLRALAVTRLLLPRCHLPSTTALNERGGLANALFSGADVVMLKATPQKYVDLYDIYPRAKREPRTLAQKRAELAEVLDKWELVPDWEEKGENARDGV